MSSREDKAPPAVRLFVHDPPKFDLDSYIANYDGPTRVERLLTIGTSSRYLAVDALKAAVLETKRGKDVQKYAEAARYLQSVAPKEPLAVLDREWMDLKERQVKAETDRLEQELKGYKNNLIKESIRMGNEDLGAFYYEIGDYAAAFKAYSRMRENCTTQKHVCEMNLKLMLVIAAQGNWRLMATYAARAQSTQLKPEDKAKIEPVIAPCLGLAAMCLGSYREAAQHFLATDPQFLAAEPVAGVAFARQVLSANDVAVYGGLCALASMDRAQLQRLVLDNAAFRNFLELEPHVRRAVACFTASKFTQCLATLEAYRADYLLDVHLQRHAADIYRLIRRKSIVQYVKPYSEVELGVMARAFAVDAPAMQKELVDMVVAGELDARVDLVNGLVVATSTDQRAHVHERALKMAAEHERALRLRLFRINCLSAGIELKVIKQPDARGGRRPKFDT